MKYPQWRQNWPICKHKRSSKSPRLVWVMMPTWASCSNYHQWQPNWKAQTSPISSSGSLPVWVWCRKVFQVVLFHFLMVLRFGAHWSSKNHTSPIYRTQNTVDGILSPRRLSDITRREKDRQRKYTWKTASTWSALSSQSLKYSVAKKEYKRKVYSEAFAIYFLLEKSLKNSCTSLFAVNWNNFSSTLNCVPKSERLLLRN